MNHRACGKGGYNIRMERNVCTKCVYFARMEYNFTEEGPQVFVSDELENISGFSHFTRVRQRRLICQASMEGP